jgi:hypothetical protein
MSDGISNFESSIDDAIDALHSFRLHARLGGSGAQTEAHAQELAEMLASADHNEQGAIGLRMVLAEWFRNRERFRKIALEAGGPRTGSIDRES